MNVDDLIDESKLPSIVSAFRDLLLVYTTKKLTADEEAKKKAILKNKRKIQLKKEDELNEIRVMEWKRSELEWIVPWNTAKMAGINAIRGNQSISRVGLTKVIIKKINEFYVPERDSLPSWLYNELLFTFPRKTPSELLYKKSDRIAVTILAQHKKNEFSTPEKGSSKEKRKQSLARRKLSEQITDCWQVAKMTGKHIKKTNPFLTEAVLAKFIFEDVKNLLVQINCPQSVTESTPIDVLGLWRSPSLLEAESVRLSKLIIVAFNRRQTRKKLPGDS